MEFNATFLVSAISFIIFTLIMNKLLYQPLSDIIAKRQQYVDANSAEAKGNYDLATSIKADKEAKINCSKAEVKKMIAEEVANSKEQKNRLEKEKKAEVAQMLASQKSDLDKEKSEASNQIESKLDDLSQVIIEKLTGGSI